MIAADTHERILWRMFRDIHKNGLQGVHADRVIAELGITKGDLYHYFSRRRLRRVPFASLDTSVETHRRASLQAL